jgi:trimethylamine--corrinoid protein Co-methyltransferase
MDEKCGLRFRILAEHRVKELHWASLKTLESVGIEVYSEEARALLKRAGADVREARIRIPAEIVERSLRQAPDQCTIFGRDGEPAMNLGSEHVYFGTGSECPYILDPGAEKPREFTKEDIARGIILSDGLDQISFIMCLGIPFDVAPAASDLYVVKTMLTYSRKPIVFNTHDLSACKKAVSMAAAVVGGEDALRLQPSILLYAQPTSPLRISGAVAEKIIYMAEVDLPVVVAAGIMAGATAPVTVTGRMVQANAEMLAQLVLAELVRPGCTIVYGSMCTPLDLRTMSHTHGTPESLLAQGGIAELARFYKLPTWGGGGCTASKLPDGQAVWESGNTILMSALSGINMIHDVGFLESAKTFSFEMLVIGNEIIAGVKKMLAGIADDDTAVEAIERVGPGGSYLEDEHTLQHMREAWESDLIDRNLRSAWEERGMLTMHDRARRKLEDILNHHTPLTLEKKVTDRMDAIMEMGTAS